MDKDTLLTPAAKDAIHAAGLTIQESCCPAPETAVPASCCQDTKPVSGEINADLIFKVLIKLQEAGLLNTLLSACESGKNPYIAECDEAGFKLIRGASVKTEMLETGDPSQNGKVNYREIIGADDGASISAGIITIDNVTFDWLTECQEIYYIISGCITVTIGDKVYEACAGDAFFIKKGIQCKFGAKGLGKAFYATY